MATANAKSLLPSGESDGQKIDRLNTALIELDAATLGQLSGKSVAGSGNITLDRAEALNACFKFTGVLTGARVVLIPVSLGASRLISVWNATTGAFTLTIKTTAGGSTGVAVTQGKAQLLFHDDTNVHPAAPEVTP